MVSKNSPSQRWMRAWAELVVRYRWTVLIANLVLTGWFGYQAVEHSRVDTSLDAFLEDDSAQAKLTETLHRRFGNYLYFQVVAGGDVFSADFLGRLRALHAEIESLELPLTEEERALVDAERGHASPPLEAAAGGDDELADFEDVPGEESEPDTSLAIIDEVSSLTNVRVLSVVREDDTVEDTLSLRPLLDEVDMADDEALVAFKGRVLADRALVGQVVNREGSLAVVLVRTAPLPQGLADLVYERLSELARRHSRPGFELHVGGLPALQAEIEKGSRADLRRLLGVTFLLMLGFMAYLFRHPIGIVTPLIVVGISVLWTIGLMAMCGEPLSIVTNVIPSLLLCIGIGDAIHIQSVYRELRCEGMLNREAIVAALEATTVPVLFTSATTAAGLLSFVFADSTMIHALGAYGAFGVAVACLQSLVLVPTALMLNRKSLLGAASGARAGGGVGERDLVGRALRVCWRLSAPVGGRRRRAIQVVVVALAALAVVAVGASRTEIEHRPVDWFPADSPIHVAMERMDSLSGAANILLLVDATPEASIKDRDIVVGLSRLLDHVREFRHPVTQEPAVGNVTSIVDVVEQGWHALHGDHGGALPETQEQMNDLFSMLELGGNDALRRLATVDFKSTLAVIRLHWMDTHSYYGLIDHLRRGIDEHVPKTATVQPGGTLFDLVGIVRRLLRDLVTSLVMAFVGVAVLMVLLLRDVRLALVATVSNLLPIGAVVALLGFLHEPMDLNVVTVASIALGIVVDDTIHFLYHFKSAFDVEGDVEAALDGSFRMAGRAMVSTSAVLASGFLVYVFAEMNNLRLFGGLLAMTVVVALLVDLIVVPALVRILYR